MAKKNVKKKQKAFPFDQITLGENYLECFRWEIKDKNISTNIDSKHNSGPKRKKNCTSLNLYKKMVAELVILVNM